MDILYHSYEGYHTIYLHHDPFTFPTILYSIAGYTAHMHCTAYLLPAWALHLYVAIVHLVLVLIDCYLYVLLTTPLRTSSIFTSR